MISRTFGKKISNDQDMKYLNEKIYHTNFIIRNKKKYHVSRSKFLDLCKYSFQFYKLCADMIVGLETQS